MTEEQAKYEVQEYNGKSAQTAKDEMLPKPFSNEFDPSALLPTAGTIKLTDRQISILYAPVNQVDVEIRPDGLVYLPWMEYVTRLREAFGLEWAIIPQGMPKFNKNSIFWGFWLVIQGKLAGYAIGEQEYIPSNAKMSYSDAVEGAKSNALMRLCKGIGISLDLWKPSYVKAWKEKYAETYYDETKRKKLWRKKGEQRTPPHAKAQETVRHDEGTRLVVNGIQEVL